MRMDLVAEDGGGGHKEESKELLPAGEGMEPVEVFFCIMWLFSNGLVDTCPHNCMLVGR